MAEINVTPLVDVMLVLLIIFMVTMPIQSVPVDVDLPQKTDKKPDNPKEPPKPIELRIAASGEVYWNNTLVDVSQLERQMVETVAQDPTNQPELQIDTNEAAEYGVLAKVLAAAKNADMYKIGFVQK
ncbi:MAG: biopolymer transporter ExbD [Thermomonas sp.]|uniref:ExbD/TolR family protein n=1 Tax=Thermomonas sp. TaxID=1971895 RepID=UPI001ECF1469|nr:biopolymer transporter ExbD [Thermomonas sp.]MBV2208435.1 biopolymer transporter ExbD [Thermomonas sp.]